MEKNLILNRESVSLQKAKKIDVNLRNMSIYRVEACLFTVEHNAKERLDIEFVFTNAEGATITYPIHNLENGVPFSMSIETLEPIEFLNDLKLGANMDAHIALTIEGENGGFI